MKVLTQIKNSIRSVETIEMITRAYQEHSRSKMNEIRQGVLENREFIENLSKVYLVAKAAQETYTSKKRKNKDKTEKTINQKDKTIIFLSANKRFYGAFNLKIWRQVENYLQENKADLIVVGQIGKYLAEVSGYKDKIYYFDLDDDQPSQEQMQAIMNFAQHYKDIIVFHGKFKTIMTQEVAQTIISTATPSEDKTELPPKKYLFEPSPEAILEFFEKELISAFFKQTILEHQLSKYATRMIAMYQANQNAKKYKNQLQKTLKKLQQQLFNKKQIEQFLGFNLWQQDEYYQY